ncbi:MAG TPA: PAS domain-containing protein [Longimicrobium sp.]|nr:PAS domain-containing protein [Longimicrobium sp.]
MQTDQLGLDAELAERIGEVFGHANDGMDALERRAAELLPGADAIVWEGDPATFEFTYVGRAAERVLGYPLGRWREPGFWAETVVPPDDAPDAVAFCALATGQGQDHDFQYRAVTAAGRVVRLHDVVVVLRGARNVPERLRGIMIPLPDPDADAGFR